MRGIGKYVVGFAVIGLFVAGLVVWLLIQAGAVKADNQTYEAATKVAEKLDSYVSSNGKIPSSLNDVTKESVPSSISYTKLSEERYKFCVTYKAASSGFDATQVQADLMMAAYGMSKDDFTTSNPETSYLYISTTHSKGENCQTIKPYIFSSTLPAKCPYPTTFDDQALQEYYTCQSIDIDAEDMVGGDAPVETL